LLLPGHPASLRCGGHADSAARTIYLAADLFSESRVGLKRATRSSPLPAPAESSKPHKQLFLLIARIRAGFLLHVFHGFLPELIECVGHGLQFGVQMTSPHIWESFKIEKSVFMTPPHI